MLPFMSTYKLFKKEIMPSKVAILLNQPTWELPLCKLTNNCKFLCPSVILEEEFNRKWIWLLKAELQKTMLRMKLFMKWSPYMRNWWEWENNGFKQWKNIWKVIANLRKLIWMKKAKDNKIWIENKQLKLANAKNAVKKHTSDMWNVINLISWVVRNILVANGLNPFLLIYNK